MPLLLSIGDFARATQLSITTLRHYHDERLLEPSEIDSVSGYRRYAAELIPRAQIIRRLRDVGMPITEVRAVLESADVTGRNEAIARHLARLQHDLATTQTAVAALQDLLAHPVLEKSITHRAVPAVRAAGIGDDIELTAAGPWLAGALEELYALVEHRGIEPTGDPAGVYSDALFTAGRGRALVYLPIADDVVPAGRAKTVEVPAAELAIITHDGAHGGIDREYGALADYVARHELAVDGPIREFYPVNRHHTADAVAWRTEIGWPIFATG